MANIHVIAVRKGRRVTAQFEVLADHVRTAAGHVS
jgi:hypothetical protein